MKIKITNKAVAAILIVLGLLVYLNTLANGMFWDDNDFILQNQYVRAFAVGKFFSENVIAGAGFVSNYWRPALLTVFALEWQMFHGWAAGYHFVNLAIHLADGLLLFYLLLRIFGKRGLAFAAAAVFLVHPLATEAVSYANSLGDSLSVLFMLSGTLLFLKGRRLWPMLFYALALMSKETAIIMPGLMALSAFFADSTSPTFGQRLKKILIALWPYLVMAAAYIGLRATTLNFQNSFNLYNESNIFTQNVSVRVLTFFRILAVYFGLMFWPINLHMERAVALAANLAAWDVVLGGVIFLALVFCALLFIKRAPAVSFGFFWFLLGIAPTSNIAVPINGLLYEHWLYLPLVGIFLALFWLGGRAGERWPKLKIPLLVVLALMILGFAGRAVARNTDWRDPIRFYNKTLAAAPDSYRLWNNLGMSYADTGNFAEAERAYKQAIGLRPGDAVAIYNLGNLYQGGGRTDEAIDYYKKAVQNDPKFIYSLNALLKLYLAAQRFTDAYELVRQYYPDSPEKTQYLEQLLLAAQEKAKMK